MPAHAARRSARSALWYEDFSQTTDERGARGCSSGRAARRPAPAAPEPVRPAAGARRRDYGRRCVERVDARRASSCIGEASHGTHEFYRERAEITKRLIAEAGFTAVAVEADWPDAYRVNRFVRGAERRRDARRRRSATSERFPAWMWRNADVRRVRRRWLREYNDALRRTVDRGRLLRARPVQPAHARWRRCIELSRAASIPEAAQRARERYACFDHFGRRPAGLRRTRPSVGGAEPCEQRGRSSSCVELQRHGAPSYARPRRPRRPRTATSSPSRTRGSSSTPSEYYRADVPRRASRAGTCATGTWPRRSTRSCAHLERTGGTGEGRSCGRTTRTSATRARPSWAQAGELNVGQLVRERHGDETLLVGFTTYHRHGDRRVRLGRPRRAQARPAARSRAAGRSCSTSRGRVRRFLARARASLRRPAAGARDRRRLPPETERAVALLPRPAGV